MSAIIPKLVKQRSKNYEDQEEFGKQLPVSRKSIFCFCFAFGQHG